MTRSNSERAQSIVKWHDQEVRNGEEFTNVQLRERLGLSVDQLEYVKRNNPCLRKALSEEQIAHRRGVYVKKSNWYYQTPEEIFDDQEPEYPF